MPARKRIYLAVTVSLIAAAIACSTPGQPAPTMPPLDLPTSAPGILSPTPPGATPTNLIVVPVSPSPGAAQPTRVPPTSVPPTAAPIIPTAIPIPPGPTPKRLSFATGATQAQVTGSLAAGGADRYVLRVGSGQVVEVSSPQPADVQFRMTDAAGTQLANGGSPLRRAVPANGDYYVTITAGAAALNYTVLFVIPEKVMFAAGTTEVTVQGQVAANSTHHYSLALGAGQVADIQFSTQAGIHSVFYGLDSDVLQGASGTGAGYRGGIPTSQDYILAVVGGAQPVSYTIRVIVPVRISFAAAANSATLTGSLKPHQTFEYIIGGTAGKTMNVEFTPANSAKMSIYGVDGTVQWSGMGEGTFWSGALPTTQDYFINFTAGDSGVNFTLKVSFP